MTAVLQKSPVAANEADLVDRLARITPGTHWIVSCFLGLSAESRSDGRYLTELKNRIRDSRNQFAAVGAGHADTEALHRDFDRVAALVRRRADVPDAPGLAIYACEGLDLLITIPLPRPVRTRIMVDRQPHLRELRAVEAEFGRAVAVIADRAHARVFEVSPWAASELPGSLFEATRGGRFHSSRRDSPGSGEKDYHHRIERERERRYDIIVRRLKALDRASRIDGLVIGGHVRDIAGLTRFLEQSLAARLLGTARLDARRASAAQVKEVAFRLYGERLRCAEAARTQDLLREVGEGWAVNGVQATMQALSRGQLRTLLVRAETEAAEADEAVEEALGQGVEVVVIHQPENAVLVHELAGFLRFQ